MNKILYITLLLVFSMQVIGEEVSPTCPSGEFSTLIDSDKYVVQNYELTTEDGYIIVLFKVHLQQQHVGLLSDEDKPNLGKPVLMMHGLTNSADNWFLNDEGSMGFYFANKGYDVWLGNNRGVKYCKSHTNENISTKDFFDFSFHELGYYDLPAFYKEIQKNYSDNTKIVYVGHSQGTSQMFAAASAGSPARDYIESKTEKFFAFSPIAFLNNVSTSLSTLAKLFGDIAEGILATFNKWELMTGSCTDDSASAKVMETICKILGPACDLLKKMEGFDPLVDNNFDKAIRAKFDRHQPSGIGYKQLLHYKQLIQSSTPQFKAYDYGDPNKNFEKYNTDIAPTYDLSSWKIPTVLVRCTEDNLSTAQNTDQVLSHLPSGIAKLHEMKGWNHHTVYMALDPKPMFDMLDENL